MTYRWDFGFLLGYTELIWKGLLVSMAYCVGTILIGLVIGLVCGLSLLSRHRVITFPIRAYVEAFRCTPLLVQLIWIYYALPVVIKVDIPAYWAAGITLTLYVGSFYSETFRGGIKSIERGQWDAGRALGMTSVQLMRRIILPQAVKRMIPPFINLSVIQLKNTSLISVLAVADLLYQGTIITAATYRPLEVYTLVAVVYFVILYPATAFSQRLEVRLAVSD
jgi:polar amino acid transport system permease protein